MMLALSSSSCRSTVRTALRRTALMTAVQQRRRHASSSSSSSSWERMTASTTTITSSTRREEAATIRGESVTSKVTAVKATAVPSMFPAESQPHKKQHEQEQSTQNRWYLLSEIMNQEQPNLLDEILNNSSIDLLQDLVQQLEQQETILTRDDVSLIIRPLLSACLRIKTEKEAAADLAERLLFTCLARLPPSVADRYPNINSNNIQHAAPTPSPSISSADNSHDTSGISTTTTTSTSNRTTTTTTSSSSSFLSSSYPYPDADIYLKVMLTCGNLRTLAAAERVHRLFRLMISEYQIEMQYLLTANANAASHHNNLIKHDHQRDHENNSGTSIPESTTASSTSSSSSSSIPSRKTVMVIPQAPAPRMKTFKTLLHTYAVSGTLQGALYAHEILNCMEDLSNGSGCSSLSSSSSQSYISSRSARIVDVLGDGDTSIEGVLIEGGFQLNQPPDLACYNSVLSAYSKCGGHDDHDPIILQRARILWERMNVLQQQEEWLKWKNYQLDWFSYYPMLRIYHNHIQTLLQQEQPSRNNNKNAQSSPRLRHSSPFSIADDNNTAMIDHDTLVQEMQSIVLALAQTTIPANVPRCYQVLSRRQFDEQQGGEKYINQHNNEIHPITWAYQVLVHALLLSRPGNNNNIDAQHIDKKSDDNNNEILLELKRIQQAHAIVMALAGQHVDGLDSNLFPVCSNDDEEDDDEDEDDDDEGHKREEVVWPSQDVILDVILAWERLALALKNAGLAGGHGHGAATTTAAAAAAVIPERVQQLVKVAVNAPFKSLPDVNQAIDYWGNKSQWKNAPFVNQAILERLLRERYSANYSEIRRLLPTSETFAMVMWSWMNSQSPKAPYKVEWLFDQLLLLYERTQSDRCLPNDTHFYLLLSSWIRHCSSGARFDGKSGKQLLAAQHVTGLLQSLVKGEYGHAWKTQLLHARHFGIALKAWARQRIHKDDNGVYGCHPDQAHEALILWKQMVDSTNSIPPPIYCNNVLEACVNSSVDAQNICLSGNGVYDEERETKRRQADNYKVAMHVYCHMRDHEVKNKDKEDKQQLKRDPYSYALILQAWKQTRRVLPNQVFDDDPIQFVLEVMEDCCNEGLLTQTLCFEIVEFLLLFDSVDNLAKTTLGRLFGVSESAAEAILQAAPINLVRKHKSSKLIWQGTNRPSGIMIQNLPSTWTQNTTMGKVWHEGKYRRTNRKGE